MTAHDILQANIKANFERMATSELIDLTSNFVSRLKEGRNVSEQTELSYRLVLDILHERALRRLGYDPDIHRARVDSNGNVSF